MGVIFTETWDAVSPGGYVFTTAGSGRTDLDGWVGVLGSGSTLDGDSTDIADHLGGSTHLLKVQKVSANYNARARWRTSGDNAITYFSGWVYVAAEGLSNTQSVELFHAQNTALENPWSISLYQNDAGDLQAYATIAGQAAPSTLTSFSLNTWYHLEVYYDYTNLLWAWRANGITVGSGALTGSYTTGPRDFLCGDADNSRTLTAYYDDISVNTDGWSSPIVLLAKATDSGGAGSQTTAAIDTTGASLLVVIVSSYLTVATSDVSDSKGNTWHYGDSYGTSASAGCVRIWYADNPTVGADHTFTCASTNNAWPTIHAYAFANTLTSTDVLGEWGGEADSSPGTVTGAASNDLIMTGWGSNASGAPTISGFAMLHSLPYSGGVNIGAAVAATIATSADDVVIAWDKFAGGSAYARFVASGTSAKTSGDVADAVLGEAAVGAASASATDPLAPVGADRAALASSVAVVDAPGLALAEAESIVSTVACRDATASLAAESHATVSAAASRDAAIVDVIEALLVLRATALSEALLAALAESATKAAFQNARPAADIVDGGWTNELGTDVDLFDSIGEGIPDNGRYVLSSTDPVNDVMTVALSSVEAPIDGEILLRVWAKWVA